jgi:hypothetical protein
MAILLALAGDDTMRIEAAPREMLRVDYRQGARIAELINSAIVLENMPGVGS